MPLCISLWSSHCGASITSSHNINRLEWRRTGRKEEKNIMKNGWKARTAHVDLVILKANIEDQYCLEYCTSIKSIGLWMANYLSAFIVVACITTVHRDFT